MVTRTHHGKASVVVFVIDAFVYFDYGRAGRDGGFNEIMYVIGRLQAQGGHRSHDWNTNRGRTAMGVGEVKVGCTKLWQSLGRDNNMGRITLTLRVYIECSTEGARLSCILPRMIALKRI